MTLPRYQAYKDSGIEWLGEVPAHWSSGPLKYLARLVTGMTPPTSDNDNYAEDGFPWVRPEDISEGGEPVMASKFLSEKGRGMARHVGPCSVLICCIGTIGKTGMSYQRMSTNQQITAAESTGNPRYLYFVTVAARRELEAMATGNVLKILNTERLGAIKYPIPPFGEQATIATFLDHETSKIDALIAEQKNLIALLKEKRQAVISHAVTKGLNPDVPMKDSGVEWLGEVPEHWEVTRIKYHCSVNGRIGFRGYTTEDQVDEGRGALVLGATHITPIGEINLNEPVYISWAKYYESPEIMVEPADVLMVQRGSTCGKVGFVANNHGPATINPSLVLLKNFGCSSRLIFLYLSSTLVQRLFECVVGRTAIPMLSQEQIGDIAFCLPPLKEQEQIIAYLDDKTAQIDTLITEAQRAICLLQERRSALISAAVTGKIDVRGLVREEAA